MFHQSFYPQQQQQRPSSNFFMPSYPFGYPPNPGPVPNQSAHNLHFTRDFERFSMPTNSYPFYDVTNQNFDQRRWRQNHHHHHHHHHRAPAFHFQDQSSSYYMTDPIVTDDDRLTIQLTKVHIGPNGDQQRVFVEQEFSNEKELNHFVRNLRRNFEKTFNNHPSSNGSSQADESNSNDSKKPGVVVVEEPDEEPKIYQQQAYNEKFESKKGSDSSETHPTSPKTDTTSPPKLQQRSPSTPKKEHHRRRYTSPPVSHMSSSSTRGNHRRRNKMKYRRQQNDQREEIKSSRVFQTPSFSRPHHATATPPRFQQGFYPNNNSNIPPNNNFQWRSNQHRYPKTSSRSNVPPMNDHFPTPPPPVTPSHFQHVTDPFFQPIHPTRFAPPRQKDFRPPPSPANFRRTQHQPTTVTDHLSYPTNNQQQPRVHRTKSECQNTHKHQQQRSRSTTNHFGNFSPLQQPPIIQRHFVPFRSPPVLLTPTHSTTPLFYPNQRRQFGSIQPQSRFFNQFRLGTNRF